MACVLAWLVPGGGHFFLKHHKKGLIFLVVILGLFSFGLFFLVRFGLFKVHDEYWLLGGTRLV